MNYIDTHSHFNLSQFDGDHEEAIMRMNDAQVGTICIGIDHATSVIACELAETHDTIWACIGIHPTEWEQTFDLAVFSTLAERTRVVAVGECGLDYFREKERAAKSEQRNLFEAQIHFARIHDLPLMLHIRSSEGTMDAYKDALALLTTYKTQWPTMRGTAHFFAGTKEIADRFLALGFHISFSGVITFVPEYENVVRHIPLERILSETDAPFAAPAPYRGKRNEPSYVGEIVKKIAEIKQLPLETVEVQLLDNARKLFRI